MAKYDVFISYSRLDTKIADRICEAFDAAGITYFIDRQGLSAGMEFPKVLAEAIENSKLFLFLASQNSYKSKFTDSEITYAFNIKPLGEIIPYIIDDSTLPPHLQFIFAAINWQHRHDENDDRILIKNISTLRANNEVYPPRNQNRSSQPPVIVPPIKKDSPVNDYKRRNINKLKNNNWIWILIIVVWCFIVVGILIYSETSKKQKSSEDIKVQMQEQIDDMTETQKNLNSVWKS